MILIAAGSNLPFCGLDSQQIVFHSFLATERFARVVARSAFYSSPAWPDPRDPSYVNAAAQIETDLSPDALLAALHSVETAFGRRRTVTNAPRSLDLDLIAYHDIRADHPVLPHPRCLERDFVLAPICDFAPDWRPPGQARSAEEILENLPNRSAKRIK